MSPLPGTAAEGDVLDPYPLDLAWSGGYDNIMDTLQRTPVGMGVTSPPVPASPGASSFHVQPLSLPILYLVLILCDAHSTVGVNYTYVHQKRRGGCQDCGNECVCYVGSSGPCEECGCYPTRHVDIDRPSRPLKRKRSTDDESTNSGEPALKKPKYLIGTR